MLDEEMIDQWKIYNGIYNHFGRDWLNDTANQTHPLFRVYREEINYFKSLDMYLKEIPTKKSITDQLHDKRQFWDVYYEFEINYFLKQFGLKPQLHNEIDGKETDILLEEQKVVLEITHLDIPYKVEEGLPHIDPTDKKTIVGKCYDISVYASAYTRNMKRYLDQKRFQESYPNIVCFCTHLFSGDCRDLENLMNEKNYTITEKVSALAIWKDKRILCLFENSQGRQFEWKSGELQRFFNYQPKARLKP